MKKIAMTLLLSSFSLFANANSDTQCLTKKYNSYIDASLTWYHDLISQTVSTHPDLKEVGDWFLEGRKHHFELNRAAFSYYLKNDSSKVSTDGSVESWLKLEQADIKALASREDQLGTLAKTEFKDRQTAQNAKNYELRNAFVDVLTHPTNIQPALDKYNQSISQASSTDCG